MNQMHTYEEEHIGIINFGDTLVCINVQSSISINLCELN